MRSKPPPESEEHHARTASRRRPHRRHRRHRHRRQQPRLTPPGEPLGAAGGRSHEEQQPADLRGRLRPAARRPAADPIQQLKELADLKTQGILTDEEFAVQKAKILGS